MSILTLLLACVAFVLLGVATDVHHRRRFGCCPPKHRSRMLRTSGWLVLFASVISALLARGWVFGPILWTGAIMAGAGIAFLILNFIPARVDPRHSQSSVEGL